MRLATKISLRLSLRLNAGRLANVNFAVGHRRPRRALMAGLLCLVVAVVLPAPTLAQRPRPSMTAVRFAEPPRLDGEVLSESLWMEIEPATGFVQVEPDDGRPASERTEVRIGFDDSTLYIGIVCFDSEPDTLVVSDSRRDASLGEDDSFRVIFDTFRDRQNGFVFGTNLAGIQYDGQVNNEGRGGGRGRRGGGGGFNRDWNTSWEVRTRTGDFGWSAEMAIPFRSLRYGSAGGGEWGVNFERNIRRKNERAFWAPLGRQFNLFRVSEAGVVTGIEAPKQRLLQITPYALIEARDDGVSGSTESDFDAGLDLKYGITPSLTLDLTVNTDFAQVEADEQQINLDRFSLFFPEKRPFFLENAGLFRVGNSGTVDLFFSRRIGLEGGQPVPILGGARVSGKVRGFNVGLLNMQTDDSQTADGDFLQANNFTVVRMARELPNRSRIGVIAVNREGTGSLAPDNDYNRTFGVDGQIGLGRYAEISGWVAKTETPGVDGRDRAFSLDSSYSSPKWRWRAGASEVGNEFNPEVGFLSRRDYRRLNGFFMRRFRPADMGKVKEIAPRFFYDSYWDLDGFHETERYSVGGEIESRSGARISLSAGGSLEGLHDPFEIAEGIVIQPGTYRTNGIFIFLNSSRRRAVSFRARIQAGGFFDGDQFNVSPSINLRLGDYLSSELSWSRNDIDLSGGSFVTNLARLRVTYAFSTEMALQALIQYNDVGKSVSTNLRFSWVGEANTGLFVVYNEIQEFGMLALPEPDRSLIVKYSRVFDVFE